MFFIICENVKIGINVIYQALDMKSGCDVVDFIRKNSFFLVLVSILIFIISAGYLRGLFFDTDIYLIEILISIIFMTFLLIQRKDVTEKISQPHLFLIILIPMIYFIHTFIAENQLYAFQQFFRWVLAVQIYILVILIKEKKWVYEWIWFSLLLTGVWTSYFGWMAAYQLVDFKDAFLGYRISSVFQYPNTFAAILTAILIGILTQSAILDKWKYKVGSLFSYLILITIVFTYSRGAWLLLAFIWIVSLFLLKVRQQILFIIHTMFLGIAVLLTLTPLTETITNKDYGKGLTMIIAVSFIVGIAYIFISLLNNRISFSLKKVPYSRLILPFIIIIFLFIGYSSITNPVILEKLPDMIKGRIQSINMDTYSVISRNLFYQDASKIIMDYPLFGAGGGAWKELYERYQEYPYTSRQAHNFYYQLTVETGIVGLVLFGLFVLFIFISLIKARNNLEENEMSYLISFGLMTLVLLMHSYIDFNMSYAYFHVLVMILLGLLTYPMNWSIPSKKLISYTVVLLILALSIISMFNTGQFIYADKLIRTVRDIKLSEAEKIMDKVISLNPYEIGYRVDKINIYYQAYAKTNGQEFKNKILTEANAIEEMKQKNPSTMLLLSQIYAKTGYLVNSMEVLDIGLKNGPWRIQLYEQKVNYAFNMARYYKEQKDEQKYKEMIDAIYSTYNEVLKRREYLDQQIPALKYGAFRPTETMRLYIGQTDSVEGKVEEGLKLLVPLTKSKDENIKNQAIAWTVHGYLKLNNLKKAEEFFKMGDVKIIEKKVNEIKGYWE